MSKFERIIQEPLVMGGQARIRDTGITVNEIVRLSLAGSSQAEILQKFPQLEAEDVFQALGWHSDFLIDRAANFTFELQQPINIIQGYTQLLEIDFIASIENKDLFSNRLENISHTAARMMYVLEDIRLWIRVGEEARSAKLNWIDWNKLRNYMSDEDFGELPNLIEDFKKELVVPCVTDLERIIRYLAYLRLSPKSHSKGGMRLRQAGKELIFTIYYEETVLEPRTVQDSIELYLAQLLIYHSGSELKVQQEEDTVIFEFALPIVEEPPKMF